MLNEKQLAAVSFVAYLKKIAPLFYEEVILEYEQDTSSSFAADAFMKDDEEIAPYWAGVDKGYFFQLLSLERVNTNHFEGT